MRKTALIFLLTALLGGLTAIAQTAPAPGQRDMRARGPARMFQALNLTADQRTQVQQIVQNQRSQMQSLRANTSLTPEQRQQQIRDMRESTHKQLMAVLTPEQQEQFKQMRQQRRAGMRRGGWQALNLTEQQKAQIKPIFQSTRQQLQALRNDSSLTPQERHQKMQEIRQNQMAQLKSVLTPEQVQQLQQMRHRRMHRGNGNGPAPQGF